MEYFSNRFGLGLSVFEGFTLLESPRTFWLLTGSSHIERLRDIKVHTAGVPILRKMKQRLKPTTTALQIFGGEAKTGIIQLDNEQLTTLLRYNEIPLSFTITPGYVILAHKNHILGCGLYTGKSLLNQIPRSYLSPPGVGRQKNPSRSIL
ncbi:MAG: hypothetical protein GTN81_04170 [Proteobacteria bacterium]|nr:hypothetical protein [Pseudomonadota bacterium]